MSNNITDKGLEIIAAMDVDELSPIELRDILYHTVAKNYETVDEILKSARDMGLVERRDEVYIMTHEASSLEFEKPRIIKQEDKGRCKLCGRSLNTSYYIEFKSDTIGPYGSTCVRKIHMNYID
ncbi:MAG: DUF5830 family protein [Methanohalobium sp.]|uniref:DUF5830 family protein n=1 Tax=Methanohalobium sp. TaxID=2837493 RepID=UPI00397D2D5F